MITNVTNVSNQSVLVSTTQSILYDGLSTKGALALLVFSLGLLFGKILGKSVTRLLELTNLDSYLNDSLKTQITYSSVLGSLVSMASYLATVVLTLDMLGAKLVVINSASVIIIVFSLIVLALAMKDYLSNLLAGIVLWTRGRIHVGDTVFFEQMSGKVIETDVFYVRIKTASLDVLLIPSSFFFRKVVRIVRRK